MTVNYKDGKGVAPVFPLPNVILYPKALLPLHIFEPRYLELAKDCLQGDRRIIMALLRPGWDKDYFGRPPVYETAGLGEIVQWDQMDNGKYNLLVRGISRVRVTEEFGGGPYRIAQVQLLEEKAPSSGPMDVEKIRLKTGLRRLSEESVNVPKEVSIGHLADIVTVALPIETYRKQEIFEIVDIPTRTERVLQILDEVLERRTELRRLDRFLPTDVTMN